MPRNAVEADGNGRNRVNGALFGTAQNRVLVDGELITGIAPVVSVATVKAHIGICLGGRAAGKINHTVKAELLDLFFEVIKALFDFIISAA